MKYNEELRDANSYARNLSQEFLQIDNISARVRDKMAAMANEMKGQADIGDQLNTLIKERNKFIEEEAALGYSVSSNAIKRLDAEINLLEKAKLNKDLQQQFNGSLKDALGLSNEYVTAFKKGGAAALGWMAATKAVEVISDGLKNTVGLGKDLYINFGLSAGESAEIALQTAAASFSIEGMLYGTEAMADAAKSSIEYFGTISNLTMDSQKNIASLNKLGVDATKSVQLDKIFKDAAGDGSDLTDSIKVIAKKEGVTAKKLFEGMSDDMSRLVGATDDEIKAMAQTNAQLIKRGLSMKQLEDISNNVLSVEQSMRAEAKARAFIGRDINANGVRQAALALQTATTENGRNAAMLDMSRILEDQVGSAKDFNNMSIMQRKLFADAYGMSVDGISEMLTKQEQFNKLSATGMSDDEVLAEIKRQEAFDATIVSMKAMGSEAGSLTMAMLPALASAKELGLDVAGLSKKLGLNKIATVASTVATGIYNGVLATKNFLVGAGTALMNGNFIAKTKDFILEKATAAQALVVNGYMAARNVIMNTTLARYIALGAAQLVTTARTLLGIGATVGQTTANVGLAASQTALGTTGAAAGGGMAAAGAGLGAFGAAAAPAIPIILAIGAALLMAAPAIWAFSKVIEALAPIVTVIATVIGDVLMKAIGALPEIITAVANGFVTMFSSVSMDNIGPLLLLGPALFGIAAGLMAVGYMGLPGLAILTGLALIGPSLMELTSSAGGGAGSETESGKDGNTLGELLTEIKGLRQDLQAQPIMINVDGKVVSKISRVQSRQNVSKQGYGG